MEHIVQTYTLHKFCLVDNKKKQIQYKDVNKVFIN